MRILLKLLMSLVLVLSLMGCAHDNLSAPCPDFGAHCTKVSVNGWDQN